jgi:uncharacterized membrane protein YjjP (DUF1212 family)
VDRDNNVGSSALGDELEVLTWFGALMLRSGNTAIRTREWIDVVADSMGFNAISVSLSLDDLTVRARRSGAWVMAIREIGSPRINASRIAELEQLARTQRPGSAPHDIALKLAEIESVRPRYPGALIAAAVALASGAFAFLNGAAVPELSAAAIGGGIGQWLRMWLTHRQLNQFGVAALAAITASGVYVLAAALAGYAGCGFAHYPAGFIASVLFLVPGFPLIGALFDLLHYQTMAGVSRLAHGVMILLAVAFGLSIVIELADIDLRRLPPLELAYPLQLPLRAFASFIAGGAFAMLFNSSPRTILAAGILAVVANDLRLVLIDMGMMLAPAAFFAAVTIGIVALWVDQRFKVPRMAMTVAPIVIMIPGIYVFETIVLFNRGQMIESLQASAQCAFVIGALAMGLATARFFSRRQEGGRPAHGCIA